MVALKSGFLATKVIVEIKHDHLLVESNDYKVEN